MLEINCEDAMLDLDSCTIYEDKPCPASEALTLACDQVASTTTKCGYAWTYSKQILPKEDDCEKMKGFVCNVS